MNKETIIGLLKDYDNPRLVSFDELKEYIRNWSPIFSLKQYFDWRYNTNLVRFVYDPYTGEKINWDELKNISKNIDGALLRSLEKDN